MNKRDAGNVLAGKIAPEHEASADFMIRKAQLDSLEWYRDCVRHFGDYSIPIAIMAAATGRMIAEVQWLRDKHREECAECGKTERVNYWDLLIANLRHGFDQRTNEGFEALDQASKPVSTDEMVAALEKLFGPGVTVIRSDGGGFDVKGNLSAMGSGNVQDILKSLFGVDSSVNRPRKR